MTEYTIPFWLHMPIGFMLTFITIWFMLATTDPKVKLIKISNGMFVILTMTMIYWSWIIWG